MSVDIVAVVVVVVVVVVTVIVINKVLQDYGWYAFIFIIILPWGLRLWFKVITSINSA